MNYAIFRCQPIKTLKDLSQIGSHNKREKKAYNSNPDIKLELKDNNIELVPLAEKYVKGFYNITKEYKKEHDERMSVMREDRKKTFNQMLDKSKNVVADELMFTATNKFFKNMSVEEIKRWANTCMEFVYNDLGYTKEQVLHSVIHLDEKTPHIHCVVVPLVKKYDKRTNSERYTISKKQYIKDNIHLSELQDKCHKRLTDAGFELERGIKESDSKNLKIKEFKKVTRYYENKSKKLNEKMDCAINEFEEKMKTTKNIPFNKTHVLVEKETFDSMNNVINETKKVMEFQPKLEQLFDEVNNYTKSHQTLEKENKVLTNRVNTLTKENNTLKERIKSILKAIKTFFRQLLLIGNELTNAITTSEIKDYFDDKQFSFNDVYDISKETTKEDDLFDYVGIPSYYKTEKKNHNDKDKKDDFDLII